MQGFVVFLHSPATYKAVNPSGIFAFSVETTPYFEYYPVGLLSLLGICKQLEIDSELVNVAALKASGNDPDLKNLLNKREGVTLIALDLHWMVHAPGVRHTVRELRRWFPEIPILLGGFTASYFAAEVITWPEVDFILVGDSTERSFELLLRELHGRRRFDRVPNLIWKNRSEPTFNAVTYRPRVVHAQHNHIRAITSVNEGSLDMAMTTMHRHDTVGKIVILYRGCQFSCLNCGGSNKALGRRYLGHRPIVDILNEVEAISRVSSRAIVLYGDPRFMDFDALVTGLRKIRPDNMLGFEFHSRVVPRDIQKLSSITARTFVRLSPESHDERIRHLYGRQINNDDLHSAITASVEASCLVRLFYMIGLPYQSRRSALETIDSAINMVSEYGPDRIASIICPLGPYVDPGSPMFETPEKFGCRLFYRTLEEHIDGLESEDEAMKLNYETELLSREEIVELGYIAAERLPHAIELSPGVE